MTFKHNYGLLTLKEVYDILHLGDVIFPVTAVVHKKWEYVVELPTRMGGIQRGQLPEDSAPDEGNKLIKFVGKVYQSVLPKLVRFCL